MFQRELGQEMIGSADGFTGNWTVYRCVHAHFYFITRSLCVRRPYVIGRSASSMFKSSIQKMCMQLSIEQSRCIMYAEMHCKLERKKVALRLWMPTSAAARLLPAEQYRLRDLPIQGSFAMCVLCYF